MVNVDFYRTPVGKISATLDSVTALVSFQGFEHRNGVHSSTFHIFIYFFRYDESV